MWQRVGEHISGSNVSLVGKPTHPDWSGVIVLKMQTTAVSSMCVWEKDRVRHGPARAPGCVRC